MSELPDAGRTAFEEEARELRALFVEARRSDLARLAAALDARDFGAVHAVGHVFRGSGSTFGFPEASRLGARLEDAAAREDANEAREIAAALAACLAPGP